MNTSRILVAHLGARKHYQEPIIFHQWGILDRFYTDFYAGNSRFISLLRQPKIYSHLPSMLKKGLDRYSPELKQAKIIHFPKFGYKFTDICRRSSLQEKANIFIWAGKEFGKRIIQNGLGDANTVYGFNGESLELFEYALSQGIRCILDQTVAERSLVNKLLLEEEKIWENWSKSPFSVNYNDLELLQREQREQNLANHIICGSNFVKDSLVATGISGNKISVVALGRKKERQSQSYYPECKNPQQRRDRLRILFAGTITLRKGIPYLLEALRQIKGKIPFVCKIAGAIEIKHQRVAEYGDVCEFLGQVPRSAMAQLYTWADVFVLPSICEGSAMVTYEALSYGLPIITTYNSGSIVRDSIDGYIVPIRNSVEIANKLLMIYENKLPQRGIIEKLEYREKFYIEACEKLKACVCNQ